MYLNMHINMFIYVHINMYINIYTEMHKDISVDNNTNFKMKFYIYIVFYSYVCHYCFNNFCTDFRLGVEAVALRC